MRHISESGNAIEGVNSEMLGSNLKENMTVGPVAGKRPKVALKPGRSLMDWVRLGLSGRDLQGQGGRIRKVTMEELGKHNKEDDCWTLLRGKVYNITSYIEFHPGGIPELMRAAGKDGTQLFDEIHKWVNIESMLAKCFIGPIDAGPTKNLLEASTPTLTVQSMLNSMSADDSKKPISKASIPRYEWYQNEDNVTLTIYTKDKDITEENLIVDCSNGKTLNCKVLFPQRFYQIYLELEDKITNFKVKPPVGGSGKLELLLQKSSPNQKWSSLGMKLEGNGTVQDEKNRELVRRRSCVSAIKQITSNTKLFSLKLPELVYYKCPIGHHVLVEEEIHGIVVGKNYTVVLETLNDDTQNRNEDNSDSCLLHLMIKIYNDGALTPVLDQLNVGDMITISDPIGSFNISRLQRARSVCMVSAGTGLTPMIRIMDYIVKDRNIERRARLLFGNRYESDILWRNELEEFSNRNHDMIEIKYILSRPPDGWTGLRGRINKDILSEFLGDVAKPSVEEELLICICGPDEFTEMINGYVIAMGFTESMIHCFLG